MLLLTAAAWAQGGAVSGRVVDPQGAAVGGAAVVLAPASGASRSARSRPDGSFNFDNVAAGTYTVRVEAGGFAPFAESVTVGAGGATVNAALQVAGVIEGVTVQGALLGRRTSSRSSTNVRARAGSFAPPPRNSTSSWSRPRFRPEAGWKYWPRSARKA